MSWLALVFLLLAAVFFAIWWLERSLYHRCPDSHALDEFIGHLASEHFPWPTLEVHARGRLVFTLRRERISPAVFDLTLEPAAEGGTAIAVGPDTAADVRRVGDRAREVLDRLGIPSSEPLSVRFVGPMDCAVVEPVLRGEEGRGGPVARHIAALGVRGSKRTDRGS